MVNLFERLCVVLISSQARCMSPCMASLASCLACRVSLSSRTPPSSSRKTTVPSSSTVMVMDTSPVPELLVDGELLELRDWAAEPTRWRAEKPVPGIPAFM